MGLLDRFRRRPAPRFSTAIARDLAAAVFALHPSANDRVELTWRNGVVVSMDVPATDPTRDSDAQVDPALQTTRISELVEELSRSSAPTSGDVITVMRDRVIWMPSVVPVNPPVA